jgi:hypothetical protein
MTDKICVLPWVHTEFTTDGTANPCCLYKGNPMGNLKQENFLDVWNGEPYKNLRREFLEGKQPSGCAMCWEGEEAGYQSKRLQDNKRFAKELEEIKERQSFIATDTPKYLDLKFGTLCNLKCRTCGSINSSKWQTDEKKLYGRILNKKDPLWIAKNPSVWDELFEIMHTVEQMDFTGGEPFMIEEHFELLRRTVEAGHAEHISLHYNTNGTIRPPQKIFDLWKEFKSCEVMFSIDGIFKKFEYIRHPAKWDETWDNYNYFKSLDWMYVQVCHTVSLYNIYYLDEFVDMFGRENIYLNLLHFPRQYCVRNMPDVCKKQVEDKLINIPDMNNIISFMNQEPNFDKLDLGFLPVTERLDGLRNECYSEIFPDFYRILIDGGIGKEPWNPKQYFGQIS